MTDENEHRQFRTEYIRLRNLRQHLQTALYGLDDAYSYAIDDDEQPVNHLLNETKQLSKDVRRRILALEEYLNNGGPKP